MSNDEDTNSVEGSPSTPKPPGKGAWLWFSAVVVIYGTDWINAISDLIETVASA